MRVADRCFQYLRAINNKDMKANCTKIMKAHCVDDMAMGWRSENAHANKHRNRRHRVQQILKMKDTRHLDKQMKEEVAEAEEILGSPM